MRRAVPHLLWIAGLIMLFLGFIHLGISSMPYQDPTPALLQRQADDMRIGNLKFFSGATLFAAGLWWVALRRVTRRGTSARLALSLGSVLLATLLLFSFVVGTFALLATFVSVVDLVSVFAHGRPEISPPVSSSSIPYLVCSLLFCGLAWLCLYLLPQRILARSDRHQVA